ncbi:uncharacterized protein LOC107264978 [Cephus cinctus]|uniref:Uncharacterized protein LOC107264978 n=1 Tax=Cephus cinctus TaxID=211228 RepID=A0AAJ7BLV8_CEPCN|nr:uncharacterized protein LOC107264978 [Cephus cinctus]
MSSIYYSKILVPIPAGRWHPENPNVAGEAERRTCWSSRFETTGRFSKGLIRRAPQLRESLNPIGCCLVGRHTKLSCGAAYEWGFVLKETVARTRKLFARNKHHLFRVTLITQTTF